MKSNSKKLDRKDLPREAYANLSEEDRAQSDRNLQRLLDRCLGIHRRSEGMRKRRKRRRPI